MDGLTAEIRQKMPGILHALLVTPNHLFSAHSDFVPKRAEKPRLNLCEKQCLIGRLYGN
jgi:hypothetical protein